MNLNVFQWAPDVRAGRPLDGQIMSLCPRLLGPNADVLPRDVR